MTDKPTAEQIQRACDLANAGCGALHPWFPSAYDSNGCLTALADTIAKLDAMQEERDKARADLGEIDRIADDGGWSCPDSSQNCQAVSAIAAPYRVETDPLVAAISAAIGEYIMPGAPLDKLRAELAKRGLEIGRAA